MRENLTTPDFVLDNSNNVMSRRGMNIEENHSKNQSSVKKALVHDQSHLSNQLDESLFGMNRSNELINTRTDELSFAERNQLIRQQYETENNTT